MTLTTEQITLLVGAIIAVLQAIALYYSRKTNVQAAATHALVNSQTTALLATATSGAHAEGMLAQQQVDKGQQPAAPTPPPVPGV